MKKYSESEHARRMQLCTDSCSLLGLCMVRTNSEGTAGWQKAPPESRGSLQNLDVGFLSPLVQLLFYIRFTSLKCKTLKAFVLLNIPKIYPLTLGENSVMNLCIHTPFCDAFKNRSSAALKGRLSECEYLKLLNFHCR